MKGCGTKNRGRSGRVALAALVVWMAVMLAGCSGGTKNDTAGNGSSGESMTNDISTEQGTNESAGTGAGQETGESDGTSGSQGTEESGGASAGQETGETADGAYVILGGEEPMRFRAGTYDGEATGYAGPVTVQVTVSEDAIVSIDAVYESESENVGQVAIPKLIDQLIESNGSDIDVISGATYSSEGLFNAVDEALQQAVENP